MRGRGRRRARPAPPTSPRCWRRSGGWAPTPRVSDEPAEVADAVACDAAGRRRVRRRDGAAGRARAGRGAARADRRRTGRPSRSASAISCCSRPATRARACAGLGVVQGHVGRFPATVRVPQFGWNVVQAGDGARLLEAGYAYFANSYRATAAPGWTVAPGDAWRPLRRGHGARQRPRLPVPPGAVRRLWRGAAVAVPGARLMLTSRIIPCLDVSHGRVVKGVRFQGLRDAGDPAERARLYQDRAPTRSSSSTSRRRPRAGATSTRRSGGCARCCRSRSPSAAACARSRTPGTCSRPAPTRSRSTPRRSSGPELLTEHRRALRPAVLRARDRRRAARRAASRCWSRAGARAPGIDAIDWAREARAARRRRGPADLAGTATAPARATTWS